MNALSQIWKALREKMIPVDDPNEKEFRQRILYRTVEPKKAMYVTGSYSISLWWIGICVPMWGLYLFTILSVGLTYMADRFHHEILMKPQSPSHDRFLVNLLNIIGMTVSMVTISISFLAVSIFYRCKLVKRYAGLELEGQYIICAVAPGTDTEFHSEVLIPRRLQSLSWRVLDGHDDKTPPKENMMLILKSVESHLLKQSFTITKEMYDKHHLDLGQRVEKYTVSNIHGNNINIGDLWATVPSTYVSTEGEDDHPETITKTCKKE